MKFIEVTNDKEDVLITVTKQVAIPLQVLTEQAPEQKVIDAVIDNLTSDLRSRGVDEIRKLIPGIGLDVTEDIRRRLTQNREAWPKPGQ